MAKRGRLSLLAVASHCNPAGFRYCLSRGGKPAADALEGAAHDGFDSRRGIAFVDRLLQISGAGKALRFHHFLKLPAVELVQETARLLFASAEQRRLDMAFERIEGDVLQKRVCLGGVLCGLVGGGQGGGGGGGEAGRLRSTLITPGLSVTGAGKGGLRAQSLSGEAGSAGGFGKPRRIGEGCLESHRQRKDWRAPPGQ